MHKNVNNLIAIKDILKKKKDKDDPVKIIAVSKTFDISEINPLIDYGHVDFGENQVQESVEKWSDIRKSSKNLNSLVR